jgi:hypothetical protein
MSNVPTDMPKTKPARGSTDTVTPTEGGWAGSQKKNETQGSKKAE